MFTPEDREGIRERLLELARADERISGAALTGSAAEGSEDRWSDVDIFLGVNGDLGTTLTDWTALVYAELRAVHHFDVRSDPAVYRVFLLPGCLQVDIAFTPAENFGARGPHFRAIFGDPIEPKQPPPPDLDDLVGRGWLAAIHARVSIERGRFWQAEYWIGWVRDQAMALACLRLGAPTAYAKGIHLLPEAVTTPIEATLVHRLTKAELSRAFAAAVGCFVSELQATDANLAARLEPALTELAGR